MFDNRGRGPGPNGTTQPSYPIRKTKKAPRGDGAMLSQNPGYIIGEERAINALWLANIPRRSLR
eukprot:11175033-Lingulodinium_polyedra.AAC.1